MPRTPRTPQAARHGDPRPQGPADPHGPTPTALPAGSARDALRSAAAALDAAEAAGHPAAVAAALLGLARAYRQLGALPAALHGLDAALRWTRASAAPDALAELLCERAETHARLADEATAFNDISDGSDGDNPAWGRGPDPHAAHSAREAACDDAFEAALLAERVGDGHWAATLLLRASDVLDRCGDHDDALQLQLRALHRMQQACGGLEGSGAEGFGTDGSTDGGTDGGTVGRLDSSPTPGSRARVASA